MKAVMALMLCLASAGSLFIMCSLMVQYAADLEAERKFITSSSAAIREAFSEFSITTDSLLSAADKSHPNAGATAKAETRPYRLDSARGAQLRGKSPPQGSAAGLSASSPELMAWTARFLGPSLCEQLHRRNVFLLHMRKAAGTTIRNYLQGVTKKSRSRYLESEGISISAQFQHPLEGVTTVMSLRHPVERVFSMYWYEHVAWWNEIKHDMSKCSTMKNWVEAWRDGSSWKTNFLKKNPSSTYVEIENYYVKTLTGWKGPAKVTRADLEEAKKVLERFDVVVIAEWLKNETQKKFLK
jgi:hypothetical protein